MSTATSRVLDTLGAWATVEVMDEYRVLCYTVPGKPTPKARPRMSRGGFIFTPKSTKNAETASRQAAEESMPPDWPKDVEYELDLSLYFANRAGMGDVDNILKLHSDALNGTAWFDDRQVRAVRAERFFDGGKARTVVTITAFPTEHKYGPPAPRAKKKWKYKRAPRTVKVKAKDL